MPRKAAASSGAAKGKKGAATPASASSTSLSSSASFQSIVSKKGITKAKAKTTAGRKDEDSPIDVSFEDLVLTDNRDEILAEESEDNENEGKGQEEDADSELDPELQEKPKASSKTRTATTKAKKPTKVIKAKAKKAQVGQQEDATPLSPAGKAPLGARDINSPGKAVEGDEVKGKSGKSRSKASAKASARSWEDSDDEEASSTSHGMTEEQIQTVLANFDVEAEKNLRSIRMQLELSLAHARSMIASTISRIPRAVRELEVQVFVQQYEGDMANFMQSPSKESIVRGKDWENLKEQVVNAGLKRGNDASVASSSQGASSRGKKARMAIEDSSSSSSAASTTATRKANASASRTGKGKAATSTSSLPPSSLAFSSSPQRGGSSSARHHFDSSFNLLSTPSGSRRLIDAGLTLGAGRTAAERGPTTPGGRARVAKVGEQVQWMSLNGSPLLGVIAADGRVRQIGRASDTILGGQDGSAGSSSIDGKTSRGPPTRSSFAFSVPLHGSSSKGKESAYTTDEDEHDEGLDDSIGDDLPDEATYTAQIIAAETSRRAAQQKGSSRGSHQKQPGRVNNPFKVAKARNRPSIAVPQLGKTLDLATASPRDLEGLTPESKARVKEAIRKYHQEQQSRWD